MEAGKDRQTIIQRTLQEPIQTCGSWASSGEHIKPFVVPKSLMKNSCQIWHAGTLCYSIIGWLDILFSSFCGFEAWQLGQIKAVSLFVPMVLLGVALLLSGGKVEVTSGVICHLTVFGRFQLSWEEITTVSAASGLLILEAPGKRLVLPSPEVWSGREKRQAEILLVQQLQERGYSSIPRTSKVFLVSRNCKV